MLNSISKTKKYKCKACKTQFEKRQPWQVVCGDIDCAIVVVNKAKAAKKRIERKETKQKLDKMKGLPALKKAAQAAFNEFIRERDYGKPCICCNKKIAWGSGATGGVCDAGHYMSRGAHVQHAFNEDNVHAQRKHCNSSNGLGGNYANYRIGLIKRIGLERVEALETNHTLNHCTKDDYREIEKKYRAKAKELRKLRGE